MYRDEPHPCENFDDQHEFSIVPGDLICIGDENGLAIGAVARDGQHIIHLGPASWSDHHNLFAVKLSKNIMYDDI